MIVIPVRIVVFTQSWVGFTGLGTLAFTVDVVLLLAVCVLGEAAGVVGLCVFVFVVGAAGVLLG